MAQYNPVIRRGIGLTFDSYVSGNAHGLMYSSTLNYTKNKVTISAGPCIQKRRMNLSGGKMSVSYLLNGGSIKRTNLLKSSSNEFSNESEENEEIQEDAEATFVSDRCQIKLHAFVQYLKDASFSYAAEKMETYVNRVENMNWTATRLSTFECGLGFEINKKIVKNMYWRNYFTATVYNHTKYVKNMQHEKYALTLTIGTSVTIPYFR